MGQKSGDRETMPLCAKCHRDFHDARGIFDYWTREGRRVWQGQEVQRCLELWESHGKWGHASRVTIR